MCFESPYFLIDQRMSQIDAVEQGQISRPAENDSKWLNFVMRHVKIHSQVVYKTLKGRDMEEAREIVLDHLDGFLLWLPSESLISSFKQSYFASTTYIESENNINEVNYGIDSVTIYTTKDKTRQQEANKFLLSLCRPNSALVARRHLEAYLVLWRSLFSLCESLAHSSNRVAQLYDWEVANNGPLFRLCRLAAYPFDSIQQYGYLSNLDSIEIDLSGKNIRFTEADVLDFYQDGMKILESRKANFDDLNESAIFRIKYSNCKPPDDSHTLPKLDNWLKKTFYEPEGIKASIVAARNYYSIMYFNIYLSLAAWAWFKPEQVTIQYVLLVDGIASTLGFLLEIISRIAVYPCRTCCIPSISMFFIIFQVLLYIIGLGEIGLWFLVVQLKILSSSSSDLIMLATFGGSVVLRIVNNLILFGKFPALKRAHHKYQSKSCGSQMKLLWKNFIFFLVIAAILVPLYYWFVVPTLSRSAFWTFCSSTNLVSKIQCYIGIIGLWIPLLSVILIMDFIAYVVVLSFYGAYLAKIKRIGITSDEAYSVMAGFKSFSTLLRKWTRRPKQGNDISTSSNQTIETMTSSSTKSSSNSSISAKKRKKIKNNIENVVSQSEDVSSSVDPQSEHSSIGKDHKSNSTSSSNSKSKSKYSSKMQTKIHMNLTDPHQIEEEWVSMRSLWYLIVDDLYDMDLISKSTSKNLYVALNWQDVPMGHTPREMIQFFFSSLASFPEKELDSLKENYLEKLCSLSQLIPSYGEAVVFDTTYLCNREKKTITNLEFLVFKYPKEWGFFYERMKNAFCGGSNRNFSFGTASCASNQLNEYAASNKPRSFPSSSDEMLQWFLDSGSNLNPKSSSMMHPDLHDEIRLWASLRGQTLYKTIRGALSYRMALTAIYEVTRTGASLVPFKSQVILAHQQYGDPSMLRQIASDITLVYKKLSCPNIVGSTLYGDTPFDLVFDWSPRDLIAQETFRNRLGEQQNAEVIRRYTLKTIFDEIGDIVSHGEALKKLIDAKSGNCPIDPKQGFPYASVISGLPKPTRISGKTWLFRYKGNFNDEFSRNGNLPFSDFGDRPGSMSESGSYSDDESSSSTSKSASRQSNQKRKEHFKWDFISSGCTVVLHDDSVHNSTAWLRCFNEESGREHDFLIRHKLFDIQPISYFKTSIKVTNDSEKLDEFEAQGANSPHFNIQTTPLNANNMSKQRIFAVTKILTGVPGQKPEVFAIVCCLNDDQFHSSAFNSLIPENHSIGIQSFGPSSFMDFTSDSIPLNQVESFKTNEILSIQRALTRQRLQPLNRPNGDVLKLSTRGQQILHTFCEFSEVLSEYASEDAFKEDFLPAAQEIFLGIEVKAIMPRRNPLILRVSGELPFSDGDRIQGKAANQMNGLRFAFGLVIQTKDANQGGSVTEALKFPIILQRFGTHCSRDRSDQIKHLKKYFKLHDPKNEDLKKFSNLSKILDSYSSEYLNNKNDEHSLDATQMAEMHVINVNASELGISSDLAKCPVELIERSVPIDDSYERDASNYILPPSIIGFREGVFTRGHGAVARFQAYAEWAFVTIVQRVLSKIGMRMHYGHPDFFSASWIYSRSSMSKANPIYNLSEDIFAGYVALLNDRRSTHTDQIQDEKGRDTSLASTYTFTAKLAQGAASQMKARDVFVMNSRLDFLRQFLLFHSSLGYYLTTTAMITSVKMYLFGLLVFSLAGYSAENLGNLEFIYSVPFLVQVGMFTLLPLILEIGVEEGIWSVLKVIIDLPFSLGYFLFQGQTTSHHLLESFNKGKSHYEATGRLLGISRKSLVDMYQLYGKSHFEPAIDYLFYVVVYYIVSSSRFGGYLPLFAPIICVVVFLIAPSGFQIANSLKDMFNDVGNFGRWIYTTESFVTLLKEWRSGPMREQMIKNLTWKATFKASHTRLQTYSIFSALKNVISTHWRVDSAAFFTQIMKAIMWGFIVISVPGGMKDTILKVLIALTLYLLLAMSTSAVTPHNKKGCWYSYSNLLFIISVAYFIALFVILTAWRYIGECVIGIFLSVKLLKSLSWAFFHLYAMFKKIGTARSWRDIEHRFKSSKVTQEARDSKTKEMKSNLEQSLLGGLYLVDIVDRPIMIISLSVVLIPVHILFNLLWSIPRISHYLMYGIHLKSKKDQKAVFSAPYGTWAMGGGFNSMAGAEEMDELPSFDFEGDADIYY